MLTKFRADQFTATKWESAEQKAKFANHFVRFVTGGYKETVFPKWFYTRLSFMFGHIAHYNKHGFYAYWFINHDSDAFLKNMMTHRCSGDPEYTYSDVELALKQWVQSIR